MWETVDLRELRVFLTLAEELHFGRAAARLSLTPSRVSQSLRSLEAKLGGQLVYRTSRRVELTPLGARFNDEAASAYGQLTSVLERTYAESHASDGRLAVGLLSGAAAGPHLGDIIDAFAAARPESHVDVHQVSWDDPFAQLRRGEFDLMVSWLPLEQPDLVIGPILSRQPRVLAVAHDHPLASREHVSVEDFADHQVPRFDQLPKELHEVWIPPRTPSGRLIPRTPVDLVDRDTVGFAIRISRGELIHPTATGMASYLGDFNIVYVPVTDMPPFRSALVWRRRATDPRLREFVRIAREVLKTRETGVRAITAPPLTAPT